MRTWSRRKRALADTLPVALAAAFAGFVLSLPVIAVLVNLTDPEESTVTLVIALMAGVPAALVAGFDVWKAIKISPDTPCSVCGHPQHNCTCCDACEGSGRTLQRVRAQNWPMPDFCVECFGAGTASATQRRQHEPLRMTDTYSICCRCLKPNFGRQVAIVEVSDVLTDIGPYDERHEVSKRGREWVFLCVGCGAGCESQEAAENIAARAKTDDLRKRRARGEYGGPSAFSNGYWGATAWEKAPKKGNS